MHSVNGPVDGVDTIQAGSELEMTMECLHSTGVAMYGGSVQRLSAFE